VRAPGLLPCLQPSIPCEIAAPGARLTGKSTNLPVWFLPISLSPTRTGALTQERRVDSIKETADERGIQRDQKAKASRTQGAYMEEEGNPAPFVFVIWLPDFLDPLN